MDRLIELFESADAAPVDVEPPQLLRYLPRHPIDWVVRFRLQGDMPGSWRACRISDISSAGAGMRIFGVTREALEGATIDISVQLCGEVRNIVDGTEDDLRVGVEFVDPLGDSVDYVESLNTLRDTLVGTSLRLETEDNIGR